MHFIRAVFCCLLCGTFGPKWVFGAELLPFGVAADDIELEHEQQDTQIQVRLTNGLRLPFMDRLYDTFYIADNGFVSFAKDFPWLIPAPQSHYDKWPVFYAFWNDIDTRRCDDNKIYYRQESQATDTTGLLATITNQIRKAMPQHGQFRARWAAVITFFEVRRWANLVDFPGDENEPPYTAPTNTELCNHTITPRNTFQIVLTTDGDRAFGIFNYRNLNWLTRAANVNADYAAAGFNAGMNGIFHEISGSRTADVGKLVTSSNSGVPGRWIFEIGQRTILDPDCEKADKSVSLVSPRYGSIFGGNLVRIGGICPDKSQTTAEIIVCKFGSTVVSGEREGDSVVTCIAPPLAGKEATELRVSVDNGVTFPDAFKTTYRYDIKVYDVQLVNRNQWSSTPSESRIGLTWDPLLIDRNLEDNPTATSLVDVEFFGWYQTGATFTNGLRSVHLLLAAGVPNSGKLTLHIGKINFQRSDLPADSNQILLAGAFRIVKQQDRTDFYLPEERWTKAVPVIWSQLTDMDVFSRLRTTETQPIGIAPTINLGVPWTGVGIVQRPVTYINNNVIIARFGFRAVSAMTPSPAGRVESILETNQWTNYFYYRAERGRLANAVAQCLTDALFPSFCECWSASEKRILAYDSDNGIGFPKCPPTASQARIDRGRYAPESNLVSQATCNSISSTNNIWESGPCHEHSGATLCVNSFLQNYFEIEQQCCYHAGGNLMDANMSPGGGRVQFTVHYHADHELGKSDPGDFWLTHRVEEYLVDRKPQEVCCPRGGDWGTQKCQLFRRTRRGGGAKGYVPPLPPGGGYGDPHVATLDGLQYTFNGLGEFIVLSIPDYIEIQGRTAKIAAKNGIDNGATVWSGLAIKANNTIVQVILSTKAGLSIFVQKQRLELGDFADFIETDDINIYLVRDSESHTVVRKLTVHLIASGIAIYIIDGQDTLIQFQVSLPGDLPKTAVTSGLLGVQNGNQNDDLLPRGATTPISPTASLEDIFFKFGETWRVSEAESLFVYNTFGAESYEVVHDMAFRPSFITPAIPAHLQADADRICAGNSHCLFDVAITQDLTVGQNSIAFVNEVEESTEIIEDTVFTCGFPPVTSANVRLVRGDSYNLGDSVEYGCHHPDSTLTLIPAVGDRRLDCTPTGWSGTPLRCVITCRFTIPNAKIDYLTSTDGDNNVRFTCSPGYEYYSGAATGICRSHGTLSLDGDPLICVVSVQSSTTDSSITSTPSATTGNFELVRNWKYFFLISTSIVLGSL